LERKIKDLQTINLTLSNEEKAQRNANLTKDRIFSIISHDLRSPINTIAGFLNVLGVKLKSIGDIELKALTNEMEESIDRLSRFLDDLLRWSMTQMGNLEANPEALKMDQLVQENYQLVESRINSKNIQFIQDLDPNASPYADANMINLVLRNLISNAIKFTRQGGYIAVGVQAVDDDWIELSVADDGIGIAKEDLQRLFEFEGSNINGAPEQKGAGLGLILCKEFVELNGGKISVQSTIGEGTRFRVLLPRKKPIEID
jgi:signal transduction histidine kinase